MTGYTIPIQKDMACANATEKISTVAAQAVSKKINGMAFKEAKEFLEKVVDGKASVNHKFHTNAAESILALLKSAENNAIAKKLDTENLKVIAASHKGPKIFRGRRKRAFGMRMKSTHVQIVLKPAKMAQKKTVKNVESKQSKKTETAKMPEAKKAVKTAEKK
ncbi:MAG: uL22 family ribosomal protein [Candidatus Aenigmatarchaeota archaeon]